MFRLTMFTMVTATLAVGCADSPQTISGRVATSSFPEPVSRVVAIGDDGTFYAPVAADGSFDLAVPAGDRYRIELRSTVRGSQLVFERAANSIDTSFFVVESGDVFDLGVVRYLSEARDSDTTIADAAVPDHSPGDSLGGGGQDTGGGGQDTGGGGQDTGGGGQDTGGGGQDMGGGGQDTGTGGGGN
jgi:hypothetical protein